MINRFRLGYSLYTSMLRMDRESKEVGMIWIGLWMG